jgi:hypothetical protein
MKKLIGNNIIGQPVIVECEDEKAVAQAKRQYAKVGIALESYDNAIKEEAKRLVDHPEDKPKYRF